MKWPNDLIYQGSKCGGILLESDTNSNTIRIGIGLNKSKREDYKTYYTDDLIELVREKESKIIDLMGYTYD